MFLNPGSSHNEREPELYKRLDELSRVPFEGNHESWGEFCIEIKAEEFYEHIALLVGILREGKWRTDVRQHIANAAGTGTRNVSNVKTILQTAHTRLIAALMHRRIDGGASRFNRSLQKSISCDTPVGM